MRECNGCTACCYEYKVEFRDDYVKTARTSCKYQSEKGCKIFGLKKRPGACSDFFCLWARGFGNDRPDEAGILPSLNEFNGGIWIIIREMRENALMTTGRNLAVEIINQIDFPGIVVDYKTPVGKDYGDYCIIKESLKPRSHRIMGDFMYFLDKEEKIEVYKLKTGGNK